jgi:hypothetical protein
MSTRFGQIKQSVTQAEYKDRTQQKTSDRNPILFAEISIAYPYSTVVE